jgi:N-acetylglutamate synthase-like GNAT family acetyltransferase
VTHTVREATDSDADEVVRLLDAAMLEFDRERMRERIADGDVLVAIVRGHNREERHEPTGGDAAGSDDRVVGACVLHSAAAGPTEIEHIAVHRSRRDRGIGTDLLETAAARTDGPLVARFREGVRAFYESLGFEIDEVDGEEAPADGDDEPAADRLRGVLR